MVTLVCRTVDKVGSFVLLPRHLNEAVTRAETMLKLGCEPMYIYECSEDRHFYKDWIINKIQENALIREENLKESLH
jgi:hypothetical protein